MLKILNNIYKQNFDKLVQKVRGNVLKTSIHLMLLVYWAIIFVGTFLIIN